MLRIGTRGSKLALWQAEFVREQLRSRSVMQAEIVTIRTSGDVNQHVPIAQSGLKGVFIKELEDALLDGRVDCAVHSLKDVPTEIPGELELAAVCERHDPRDCLVSRGGAPLRMLEQAARVGTSSLRRRAQLLRIRADLQVIEMRGNVDTRLGKVERGEFDAVVLAKAGLDRLGLSARISEPFSADEMLPAVGQGALAIECRKGDAGVGEALRVLEHAATRAAVAAERAVLARLQGGCQVPLGAYGRIKDGILLLTAGVFSPDGQESVRGHASGAPADAAFIGERLAESLLSKGAGRILEMAGRAAHGG